MQAFLTSAVVVALAEIGDKTQLLAIVLATRFGKPVPIILGILAATMANHLLAALVGAEAAAFLKGAWFGYLVALSFIAMGLWTLVPDKLDDDGDTATRGGHGVFATTLVSFFIVEMGDKTQIATVALGARFHDAVMVAAGTTLGMMAANVPAVLLGHQIVRVVPLNLIRAAAALVFIAIGLWSLAGLAGWL